VKQRNVGGDKKRENRGFAEELVVRTGRHIARGCSPQRSAQEAVPSWSPTQKKHLDICINVIKPQEQYKETLNALYPVFSIHSRISRRSKRNKARECVIDKNWYEKKSAYCTYRTDKCVSSEQTCEHSAVLQSYRIVPCRECRKSETIFGLLLTPVVSTLSISSWRSYTGSPHLRNSQFLEGKGSDLPLVS
jgi:hypothetical protein